MLEHTCLYCGCITTQPDSDCYRNPFTNKMKGFDMADKNKSLNDYIKKYSEILELADRFKTEPAEVVSFFFDVGLEALRRTESILKNEFESKLKEVFEVDDIEQLKGRLKNKIDIIFPNRKS